VVLNPPYVYGPILHEVASPAALNATTLTWYNVVCSPNAGGKTDAQLAEADGSWVDVRDLANAHVRALEKEEASEQRIIVSAGKIVSSSAIYFIMLMVGIGTYSFQDFLDAAHSLSPPPSREIRKGNSGAGRDTTHKIK
jgi:nucleoside-diphosphate-sugar epimerase